MEMNLLQRVGVLLLPVLVAAGAIKLPKMWRGQLEDDYERNISVWWPYGDRSRRAFLRIMPVSLLAVGLLSVGLNLVLFAGVLPGDWGKQAEAIGDAVIVLAVVALGLMLSIVLFNRPKFLVAPHHRKEPGLLEASIERND
jgi:hypothetical protein